MHQRSYCEGVIAIETKNKILSLFFNYGANLKSVTTMELIFFFFAMLVSQYDVISCDVSTLKPSSKFWGTTTLIYILQFMYWDYNPEILNIHYTLNI